MDWNNFIICHLNHLIEFHPSLLAEQGQLRNIRWLFIVNDLLKKNCPSASLQHTVVWHITSFYITGMHFLKLLFSLFILFLFNNPGLKWLRETDNGSFYCHTAHHSNHTLGVGITSNLTCLRRLLSVHSSQLSQSIVWDQTGSPHRPDVSETSWFDSCYIMCQGLLVRQPKPNTSPVTAAYLQCFVDILAY